MKHTFFVGFDPPDFTSASIFFLSFKVKYKMAAGRHLN